MIKNEMDDIVIESVPLRYGMVLRFREPLIMTPHRVEGETHICAGCDRLRIAECAASRNALTWRVQERIREKWRWVRNSKDSMLNDFFRVLKQAWLDAAYDEPIKPIGEQK